MTLERLTADARLLTEASPFGTISWESSKLFARFQDRLNSYLAGRSQKLQAVEQIPLLSLLKHIGNHYEVDANPYRYKRKHPECAHCEVACVHFARSLYEQVYDDSLQAYYLLDLAAMPDPKNLHACRAWRLRNPACDRLSKLLMVDKPGMDCTAFKFFEKKTIYHGRVFFIGNGTLGDTSDLNLVADEIIYADPRFNGKRWQDLTEMGSREDDLVVSDVAEPNDYHDGLGSNAVLVDFLLGLKCRVIYKCALQDASSSICAKPRKHNDEVICDSSVDGNIHVDIAYWNEQRNKVIAGFDSDLCLFPQADFERLNALADSEHLLRQAKAIRRKHDDYCAFDDREFWGEHDMREAIKLAMKPLPPPTRVPLEVALKVSAQREGSIDADSLWRAYRHCCANWATRPAAEVLYYIIQNTGLDISEIVPGKLMDC